MGHHPLFVQYTASTCFPTKRQRRFRQITRWSYGINESIHHSTYLDDITHLFRNVRAGLVYRS